MTAKAKTTGPSREPETKDESAPATPEAVDAHSIDNIARFFGGKSGAGKPGSLPQRVPQVSPSRPFDKFRAGSGNPRPAMDIPASTGAANLKKGQRVHHSKYGEGTILMREGEGEDAKLTVLFSRHGMKKLMEKFANLQKI
jgi:DNA helicase-2/ATP-dependent DNA helicase PcrA